MASRVSLALFAFAVGAVSAMRMDRQKTEVHDFLEQRSAEAKRAARKNGGGLWKAVRSKLKEFGAISFTVGTRSERRFSYSKGMDMFTERPSYQIGEWIVTTAVSGVVAAGHMTYDTLASEVFPWWTKEAADTRSGINLRHALTHTSGFESWDHIRLPTSTPEESAKAIYQTATHTHMPGTLFENNGFHLQIAMAMAVERTGMSAKQILSTYVYKPFSMNATHFVVGSDASSTMWSDGIFTTVNDLDSFMSGYLGMRALPAEIYTEMDTEYVQANGAEVVSGSLPWKPDTDFAMGHAASTKLRGPPDVQLNRIVHWWCGAAGWCTYCDRTADIYMVSAPDGPRDNDVISVVAPLVYRAMGKKFPRVAGKPNTPEVFAPSPSDRGPWD